MNLSNSSSRRAWHVTGCVMASAVLTAVIALVGCASTANAQAAWKNTHTSAGSGFVTGIVAQPKAPGLFYIRTDVGGCFRWNPETHAWIPITDFLTVQHRKGYGGESIAVDPNHPNTVYIACGMTLWESWNGAGNGTIYKSTNRGETWTKLGLKGVSMPGNDEMRWGGERLAVQPGDSDVILFGSRTQGLWRSTDGGANWRQAVLPYPRTGDSGVQAVAFDPNTPSIVYAAVAKNGIFKSADSGSTWTNIDPSITAPERLTVGPDSTVWVTYANGVAKYGNGKWTNCTPPRVDADAYCGLAINPRNPNNVIVSYGLWGDPAPNAMYETMDGGGSWTKLNPTIITDVPWYRKLSPAKLPGAITDFLYTPISNFLFDPNNPRSVWFVSAGGIFNTRDITRKGSPIFNHEENGHEELCFTALASPPIGNELIAGVMDVDGFVFDRGLRRYPSHTFIVHGAKPGATAALAYEENDPRNMVRLCANEGIWDTATMVATSSDGGFVWKVDQSFPTKPPSGGKNHILPLAVAMSATAPDNIVVAAIDSGNRRAIWLCKVRGATGWSRCSGLPLRAAPSRESIPVVADPKAAGTFYAYVAGAIYRSADGGRSFRRSGARTIGASGEANFLKLAAQPGRTADLWLSEDNDSPAYLSDTREPWEGLYHSTNGGRTWAKAQGITRALNFCFGKGRSAGTNALYFYGRLRGDGTDKIYRSTNLGRTWVNIQHPGQAIGDGPWEMEGSRRTFGRVFIGTYGRGIYYSPVAIARR